MAPVWSSAGERRGEERFVVKPTIWSATRNVGALTARFPLAIALFSAALVGVLSLTQSASAETLPTVPRPPESCTASLTLVPAVIAAGGGQPVELRISGLEPHAVYRVFVGGRSVTDSFAAGDGTATNSLFLDVLVAAAVPVQVSTADRCAQATLIVAGPLRVRCEAIAGQESGRRCLLDHP